MAGLAEQFGLMAGDRVAAVGSGGKTTLLCFLARARLAQSVLVGTTTKIVMPPPEDYDWFFENEKFVIDQVEPGVTLAGACLPDGKLGPPPEALLRAAAPLYGLVLLEADGAKRRPLKAWAPHEPVVPEFVTATVGVMPLWPLGHVADERVIHRIAEFCTLTGAVPGAPLMVEHLAKAVAGENGLFGKARGRRVLFLSQVEDTKTMEIARALLHLLPQDFLQALDRVVAGSAVQDGGEVLWQR